MTARRFDRTVHSEQVRVTGGDLSELATVAARFAAEAEPDARWFVAGDAIVFENPLLATVVGGSDYLAEGTEEGTA